MTQTSFLDDPNIDVIPTDRRLTSDERPRLSGQNAAIVARLKQGPATNDELSRIARKYTSRISDIRKAGYAVEVVDHDRKTGLVVYRLGVSE